MFEAGLPLQLRHRELNGNLPQLFTNLMHLQELIKENYNDGHSARISEILLWIATNHPEVMKDDATLLANISVTNLCFRDSYEKLDKLIPTEALTILLNSSVCRNLEKFCGYIDPDVLHLIYNRTENVRLAIGRHNIDSFIMGSFMDTICNFGHREMMFHLLCGELNENELNAFPIFSLSEGKTVYISGASDQDVDWVLKAAEALNRPESGAGYEQEYDQDCIIKLKSSTLTPSGLEDIAKGLDELGNRWKLRHNVNRNWSLGVSSPNIGQTIVEFPGNESYQSYYVQCFSFTDKEYEEEFLCERLVLIFG